MLGTGSSLLSASQPGARAERVVTSFAPRCPNCSRPCGPQCRHGSRSCPLAAASSCRRPGMTRPPPSHSPLLFRVGLGPPCAAPRHLHVTARLPAPPDTHPSRPPRWDFAHHAMTFGTRQAQSLPGRLPRACHLPVTVSRTESSPWVDWSGGFVPWHLSCEPIAQLENAPASPEARVFFGEQLGPRDAEAGQLMEDHHGGQVRRDPVRLSKNRP